MRNDANRQRLLIRTDGNEKIAMGHVMRCLSIAEAFKRLGGEVEFLLSDNYVCSVLEQRGFSYQVLGSNWQDLEQEIEQMETLLKREGKTKLLIDSYQVTERYLACLAEFAQLIYLDDLNSFPIPAAMVVNYVSFAQNKENTFYENPDTVYCLGWQYTPLRLAFAESKYQFQPRVKNILITTGGSDPFEMSVRISRQLLKQEWLEDISLHIVAGKFCQCTDILLQLQEQDERVKIYQNISNMESVMCQCDFAVSAGGTTLFELFACGVPVIAFGFVENQMESLHLLAEQQALCYMGDARQNTEELVNNIVKKAEEYCMDASLREEYRKQGQSITDGKGALRIAEAIRSLP